MKINIDLSRPVRAMRASLSLLAVSLLPLASIVTGFVSDVLTPLAPWAQGGSLFALFITICFAAFIIVRPISDERLRLWGDGLLLSIFLLFGFGSVCGWQAVSGFPERGAAAGVMPSLRHVQNEFFELKDDVSVIRRVAMNINDGVRDLKKVTKKETSDDPRKELNNMGLDWKPNDFLEQMKIGDRRTVRLYLDGGMKPDVRTDKPVMYYAIARDYRDFDWLLGEMVKAGFDVDEPFDLGKGILNPVPDLNWNRPVFVAALHDNNQALNALIRQGADISLLKQEFSLAVAKLDEENAEKQRMKDVNYCAKKLLKNERKVVAKSALSFCAVDSKECTDKESSYLYAAKVMCRYQREYPKPIGGLFKGVVSQHNYERFKRVLGLLKAR